MDPAPLGQQPPPPLPRSGRRGVLEVPTPKHDAAADTSFADSAKFVEPTAGGGTVLSQVSDFLAQAVDWFRTWFRQTFSDLDPQFIEWVWPKLEGFFNSVQLLGQGDQEEMFEDLVQTYKEEGISINREFLNTELRTWGYVVMIGVLALYIVWQRRKNRLLENQVNEQVEDANRDTPALSAWFLEHSNNKYTMTQAKLKEALNTVWRERSENQYQQQRSDAGVNHQSQIIKFGLTEPAFNLSATSPAVQLYNNPPRKVTLWKFCTAMNQPPPLERGPVHPETI